MNNSNDSTRFDGHNNNGADGAQALVSGVLSQDFPQRLERLKEASGLSWRGMARALGVDPKQLRRWRRKGVEPCGGAMLSICRFAFRIPGGLPVMLEEDLPGRFAEMLDFTLARIPDQTKEVNDHEQ